MTIEAPVIFATEPHPLIESLAPELGATVGKIEAREFPDGESYLRVKTPVEGRSCIVLANLAHPNRKFLPFAFLADTLREFGASQVGLLAPYLCYMRQDRRFVEGEAVTSRIFAAMLSRHIDFLVTVDPHLHRYHSLEDIYNVPATVVQGAPALATFLQTRSNLLLVGPDAESEQWVSEIAAISGHPFVVGEKTRYADREVSIKLPDLDRYAGRTAVIIDDVISSGATIRVCIDELKCQRFATIECAAIHGIFDKGTDRALLARGLVDLVTTNTIPHASNRIDIGPLLKAPLRNYLKLDQEP